MSNFYRTFCFIASSYAYQSVLHAYAEHLIGNSTSVLGEELLLLFPVINLMSWPCKCIKAASGDLIVMLEKIIGKLMIASRSSIALKEEFPSVSRLGKIVYRLLQHLWFQVSLLTYFSHKLLQANFLFSLFSILFH